MHDSTRRIICRIAFVAVCLLPTGTLCAWVVYRATPLHSWRTRCAWEQKLFEHTGLLASVDLVQHPTRNRVLLKGVKLTDPDGGGLAAQVRVIELAQMDRGVVAICSQPEVQSGQLSRMGELLCQRVLRGPSLLEPVQLSSGDLTLHREQGATTLTDVRCVVGERETRMETVIEFRIAGLEMPNPAQLRVARQRQTSAAATVWELRTDDADVPCEMLADHLPVLRLLGERSRFRGVAWIEQSNRSWSGEVAGRFSQVDLEQVMTPFPHKLSGFADVTISHSRFSGGRLVEIAGSLQCDGGVVSRSLLAAAAESLRLSGSLGSEHGHTLLAYKQLAFGFQLDGEQLQLSGLCEPTPARAVMVDGTGQVLLSESSGGVPAVSLTRMLVPQSDVQVPATIATEALLRALPIPEVRAPAARTATQPSARMRLVQPR